MTFLIVTIFHRTTLGICLEVMQGSYLETVLYHILVSPCPSYPIFWRNHQARAVLIWLLWGRCLSGRDFKSFREAPFWEGFKIFQGGAFLGGLQNRSRGNLSGRAFKFNQSSATHFSSPNYHFLFLWYSLPWIWSGLFILISWLTSREWFLLK